MIRRTTCVALGLTFALSTAVKATEPRTRPGRPGSEIGRWEGLIPEAHMVAVLSLRKDGGGLALTVGRLDDSDTLVYDIYRIKTDGSRLKLYGRRSDWKKSGETVEIDGEVREAGLWLYVAGQLEFSWPGKIWEEKLSIVLMQWPDGFVETANRFRKMCDDAISAHGKRAGASEKDKNRTAPRN